MMKPMGKKSWVAVAACCGLSLLQTAVPRNAEAVTVAWTRTVNGVDCGNEQGNAVARGADGSIYVVGTFDKLGEATNMLMRKYSGSGVYLWTRVYNGPVGGNDSGNGVAVGPDGSIYVVGTAQTSLSNPASFGLLLQKYSPAGNRLWSQLLEDGGEGRAVAVALDGSVYVVGSNNGKFLRKFSDAGETIWTSSDGSGSALGVATDPDGSIYVVGSGTGPTEGDPPVQVVGFWLQKYSADNEVLWTRAYAGGFDFDYGSGVAVAPDHSVVAVGDTRVYGGHTAIMLRKYTADGDLLWNKLTMGGATIYGNAHSSGVAIAPDGRIAIIGSAEPPEGSGSVDIHLHLYSATGRDLWNTTYNGPAAGNDWGHGVTVGPLGGIIATGEIEVSGHGADLWLRKYR